MELENDIENLSPKHVEFAYGCNVKSVTGNKIVLGEGAFIENTTLAVMELEAPVEFKDEIRTVGDVRFAGGVTAPDIHKDQSGVFGHYTLTYSGELTHKDATVVLNAAKTLYLNSIGGYDQVRGNVSGLTKAQFERAYLCNLDLSQDGAKATLEITGFRIYPDRGEIDVKLTRTYPVMNGAKAAPINGVLKFYGAKALADFLDPAAAPLDLKELSDGDFSAGDTVKVVYTPGENAFFKARIE